MSGDFDKPCPNNAAVQQQEPRCDKESEGLESPLGLSACAVSVSGGGRPPFSMPGPNCALTLT